MDQFGCVFFLILTKNKSMLIMPDFTLHVQNLFSYLERGGQKIKYCHIVIAILLRERVSAYRKFQSLSSRKAPFYHITWLIDRRAIRGTLFFDIATLYHRINVNKIRQRRRGWRVNDYSVGGVHTDWVGGCPPGEAPTTQLCVVTNWWCPPGFV